MPDNLYCDQTTPWQGVYFFTNTVYRENDTLYMCHSNFIVLLPHISPWTQSWIQAFIVAYQNLTFKYFKLLLQKSVLGCSKVSSGSEKRLQLHQIDQSECNIFCQNISNSNLNWYKHQPFSDWYIYKPVDMQHKWIG